MLWARPATPFVARFLGFSNLVAVEVRSGEVRAPFGVIGPASDGLDSGDPEGAAIALVRPTAIRICDGAGTPAVVRSSAFAGDHTVLELATTDGTVLEAIITGPAPSVGTTVGFEVDGAGIQLFAATE